MTSQVHPLFGRSLQATSFRRRNGALLLVVGLPDGTPGTIPADATDVLGAPVATTVTTVLSVDGVRRLRMVLETLAPAAPRSRPAAKTRK